MEYKEYLNEIISFNNDKGLVALREKYNEPSFFEIISKERSETTYSAFLKWLFLINSTRSNGVSPIMSLLDILVKRCNQQDESLISQNLQEAILSRKLKINNISVDTEKYVSQLAAIQALRSAKVNNPRIAFLNNVKDYCKDRIDIFIECEVLIAEKAKQMQIIIENKIDSKEGGAKNSASGKGIKNADELSDEFIKYLALSQTCRYYKATHQTNQENANLIQLYVYLTPLSSSRLDNFNALQEEQKQYDKETQKKIRVLRDDEHFIQINYQDILDDIVEPLLSSSVSERNRFFLEEFKNELAFPNIDNFDEQSCIAIGEEVSETMTEYWKRYKPLIIDSIIATTNSTYYIINGTYYNGQPRQEIIKLLVDGGRAEELKKEGWLSDAVGDGEQNKYSEFDGVYWIKKGKGFNSLMTISKNNGLSICEIKLKLDHKTKNLLKSFLTENSSFIFAIMNGLKADERKKIQCLMAFLTKRNSTKYTIFYKDRNIGTNLTFTDTAFRIIKCWAWEVKGKDVNLEQLQNRFPRNISLYYERGKWFRHLIYKYSEKGEYYFDFDSEEDERKKDDSNWNFYTNDKTKEKHFFEIKDGVKVVVLKMWHEEDVENLIQYVSEENLFGDDLKIERS